MTNIMTLGLIDQLSKNSKTCMLFFPPRLRRQTEVTSDQTQVQRTWCVSRPKLEGLGFGSSAKLYDQRSLLFWDGLIRSHLGMALVQSEFISVCVGLIQGRVKRTLV